MTFQTWTFAPPFGPEAGRTRANIAGFVVDYVGPIAPTSAEVLAQAAPTVTQQLDALKAQAVAAFQDVTNEAARRDRAIALAAGDGDNAIRTSLAGVIAALNTLVAAIASPTSTLASIRTAAAGIGPLVALAQIQAPAVRTAVQNRINTTEAD